MQIRTALSLSDIRNTELVMYQLKNLNVFIRMHNFPMKVHDIVSIGWFRDIHPTQMTHENISNHINESIRAVNPSTTIPPYHLAFTNPGFQDDQGKAMKTKAIEIQVEKK